MEITAVTVGIPVQDLDGAIAWYRKAFELDADVLTPIDGIAELDLGPFWLQLALAPELAGQEGISVNLSVPNATEERERLAGLGLEVSDVERYEGVVEYFELTDPDGNKIGFVTELD